MKRESLNSQIFIELKNHVILKSHLSLDKAKGFDPYFFLKLLYNKCSEDNLIFCFLIWALDLKKREGFDMFLKIFFKSFFFCVCEIVKAKILLFVENKRG